MYASVSMTKQDKAWLLRLQNWQSCIAHYSASAPDGRCSSPYSGAWVYNSACPICWSVWQNCTLVASLFYLILAGPASRSGAVDTCGAALVWAHFVFFFKRYNAAFGQNQAFQKAENLSGAGFFSMVNTRLGFSNSGIQIQKL
jgi:hypothetical protein